MRLKYILPFLLILLCGCAAKEEKIEEAAAEPVGYTMISQEEAYEMMKKDDGHILLDVRRQEEYDATHIPGAILIPNENIETSAPKELPEKDQIILIYCRSGRRSKEAAQKLADLGYTNLYEFGGILTWPYDTVSNEEEASASENTEKTMKLKISGTEVPVVWEANDATAALRKLLPLTVQMSRYGGFEQVGPIGTALPADDTEITAGFGDIMLYSTDQLVIFYGSNTWAYTKLGHVNRTEEEMAELLSGNDAAVTITEE